MEKTEKIKITEMAIQFASAFKDTVGPIAGSGWLIVDPLSGYLNSLGYENELKQIPGNEKHPQVLIMTFKDGTQFIPAGSDLPHPETIDWMWID